MSDELKTIRLYGKLGTRFGREFRLAVRNAAEAIRALDMQLPGFRKFLYESRNKGIGFSVWMGKQNLCIDELGNPAGSDVIRIAPVIQGAKRSGLFNIILGGALIAAATIATGGFGAAFAATGLWGTAASLGAALVLGGVSQLLAPQIRGLSSKDRSENESSYLFNGPVNTQAQGNPVPLAYGRVWVGSAVISAGIYAEDRQ